MKYIIAEITDHDMLKVIDHGLDESSIRDC